MLILDIGNTHTRIARTVGAGISPVEIIDTTELSADVFGQMRRAGEPCAAASVVPAASEKLAGEGVCFISAATAAGGVDFTQVDSSTLGADRVANAVALAASGRLPALVLDCGTALTIEVVDADRVFRGGAIAPGRKLLRSSLHLGTAQLPELPLGDEAPVLPGCDTLSALRFGIDRGAVGIARELLASTASVFPGIRMLASGGDARFFVEALPELLETAPGDFTLRGIAIASGIVE